MEKADPNNTIKTANSNTVIAASDLSKNSVQFRKGFIHLSQGSTNNYLLAMSVISELMQFGYLPNQDAVQHLSKAPKEELVAFHSEVIGFLKNYTGSHKNFRPFWKGFPEQVMEKTEAELWAHQLLNYWTNGAYEPGEWTRTRPTAFEQPNYTTLVTGNENRFEKIFTDLVSVNQSLTPDDMEIIKWFVNSGYPLRFPEQIPFKENLCTLAAMGLDVPVKTVTDVLRIAVGLSGGDISLPKVPKERRKSERDVKYRVIESSKRDAFKFKKFTRAERRQLLHLLEKTNCDASEAVLKDQRWIRLGEILHPGEFKNRFPKSNAMFSSIRNGRTRSWYSLLHAAFGESFEKGIVHLSERPGEFMRRVDALLRRYSHREDDILAAVTKIAPKVSNKVMYEIIRHFQGRTENKTDRTIMIKGARKRTKLPDLYAFPESTVNKVKLAIETALKTKFALLPKLDKVYIDEGLKKIPLPTNMRSLNSSLKPVIRGSRIPWDNPQAKVIRTFLRFEKDSTSCTIDLSVIMIGTKNGVVDWRNHKLKDIVVHSGDSYGRVGACAEYVDIDLKKSREEGYRFALVQLHNYNRTRKLYENNYFGVMERNFPEGDRTWLPSTIANCSIVRVENIVNCAIIDLATGEYIMVDEDANKGGWVNVASTLDFKAVEAYIQLPKFSVYDLVLMHVEARGGEWVDVVEKAENRFLFDDFSTSYVETLKLMGV